MPNVTVSCRDCLGGGKPTHILDGDGVACLSGLPLLPPPSAELTTVWGTSEDQGCHAVGQESHTEGCSVEQPAPAPFSSLPQSLPQVQHKFTSKTVCDPASFSSGEVGRGEGYGVRVKAVLHSPTP